jgi:hypothetical protein
LYATLGIANGVVSGISQDLKYARDSDHFSDLAVGYVQRRLGDLDAVGAGTAYAVALILRREVSQVCNSPLLEEIVANDAWIWKCAKGDIMAAKVHFDGLLSMMGTRNLSSKIPSPLLLIIQACVYPALGMVYLLM